MNRIQEVFRNKKAFIPFITAGMACAATLAALVVVCAAALNYRG